MYYIYIYIYTERERYRERERDFGRRAPDAAIGPPHPFARSSGELANAIVFVHLPPKGDPKRGIRPTTKKEKSPASHS